MAEKRIGKGNNPNSHNNKPKKQNPRKITLLVESSAAEMLKSVGDGVMSEGLERLDRRLKVLGSEFNIDRLTPPQKFYYLQLELIAATETGKFDRVKELLPLMRECKEYLESHRIKTDWKEAIDEGVIKVGDSWIA